ncbi:hypothetical protein [Microcoleus sp. B3-D7]|uniref:hypothetical protein n=1 Tax=Microcoleus sp. B3-D7 TaxID=2818659 RepID=UPI002FCF1BA1
MSRKILRLYIDKNSVKPEFIPVLANNVHEIIQKMLFEIYKKVNLEFAQNPENLKKYLEFIPELSDWEKPTDEELMELTRQEEVSFESESGLAAGGWKYAVRDEPNCVSATLEIYSKSHIPSMVGSSWQSMGKDYGFKISEEVVAD